MFSDERCRVMDTGGRADATAGRLAKLWAAAFSMGLAPGRWVTLEVAGRRWGQPARFPLGMADLDGRWFLVPMLGAGQFGRASRAGSYDPAAPCRWRVTCAAARRWKAESWAQCWCRCRKQC